MFSNQRKSHRFSDKSISVILDYNDGKLITGISINISNDGICVILDKSPIVGKELDLILEFNFNNELVKEKTKAKVMWTSDIGNDEFLTGLSYVDDTNLKEYLEYLEYLKEKEEE
jgi:hypothetical protein